MIMTLFLLAATPLPETLSVQGCFPGTAFTAARALEFADYTAKKFPDSVVGGNTLAEAAAAHGVTDEGFWDQLKGTEIFDKKWTHCSPLTIAVGQGNLALVKLLVQGGADHKILQTLNLYSHFQPNPGMKLSESISDYMANLGTKILESKENATLIDYAKARQKEYAEGKTDSGSVVPSADFEGIINYLESFLD